MNVFVADEQSVPVDVGAIRKLATSVLEAERCPPESEVSVMLVGDIEMADYNRRFLERSGPTDVISLPIEELSPGRPPTAAPAGPPVMLGDVIIAPGYVRDQATRLAVEFEDGSRVDLCGMHRIGGVRAKDLTPGAEVCGRRVVRKIAYRGVERSYDLLTEDAGYRIGGLPVNSMIEEMYAAGREGLDPE